MKRRILCFLLSLTLVLTLLPAGTAFASDKSSDADLNEIFSDMGFAAALTGDNAKFAEGENVHPATAFWFLSTNGGLYKFYNQDSWCYELTINDYLKLMDNAFYKFDEQSVKDYLTENGYYNPANGDNVVIYSGGLGDVWAWEPVSISQSGSKYTINGLYLYGNRETGDVKDSDVEFYDWWMYTNQWEDEFGEINTMTYEMGIENGVTVSVIKENGLLKVSGYSETPYYTYNGVTYCKDISTNQYTKGFEQSYKPKLSFSSAVYNGSAKKPTVTITDRNGKTLAAKYYSVKYSNNINPGTATVTINVDTGKYKCQMTKTFIIKLKAPVIKTSIVANSGKIKISWPGVNKATKYEIYRSTAKNGTYKKVKTLTYAAASTATKSWTDTTAVSEKTYWYKVKAMSTSNSAISSAFSNNISAVCDLAKPVISVKKNTKGKPLISWKKVANADKYTIYRATKKNGTYSTLKTVKTLSFTDTSAKKGKTYYYKVKAISTKTSKANSAFSAITSVKVTK